MNKDSITYNIRNHIVISSIVWISLGILLFIGLRFLSIIPSFRFEKPNALWLLLLIPIINLFYILDLLYKNKQYKKHIGEKYTNYLIKGLSTNSKILSIIAINLMMFFGIIALSNPQFGNREMKTVTSGVDIMIALDVSNSMLAKDLSKTKNRLEIAKLNLKRFINKLGSDRLGLVIFAGNAFNYSPLTTDHDFIKVELNGVSTDMISSQGTAIDKAIEESIKAFDEKSNTKKVIVLLTDGENHNQKVNDISEKAKKLGIQIYTVAVGTSSGSTIPDIKNGTSSGFKKDKQGNLVVSKINENLLKTIAQKTNGIFLKTQKSFINFKTISDSIKKLQKTKFGSANYLAYEDYFQLPLFLSILFFGLYYYINYFK